jgi:hypothetical protein
MDERNMELGLDTAILLELSEYSGLVRGNGGKGVFKGIKDLVLWQRDGDVLYWAWLLSCRKWLLFLDPR